MRQASIYVENKKQIFLRPKIMKISHQIIIVFSVVILCSCAPMIVEYYKPFAPGGSLVGPSSCGRIIGPRTGMIFNNGGVDTQVIVVTRDNYINISITIPDGKTAIFLSNELKFMTDVNGQPIKLKFSEISYNHYRDIDTNAKYEEITINATDTMIGKTYKLSRFLKQTRTHGISVYLQAHLPDQFYLQLPSLRYEDKEIQYPVIKFIKTKSVGVYSVNC